MAERPSHYSIGKRTTSYNLYERCIELKMSNNSYQAPKKNSSPCVHLFSAYYKDGKAKGKLVPVANALVVAFDGNAEKRKGQDGSSKPILWGTDNKGVLHVLDPDSLELRNPVHAINGKKFIVPPPEIVSFIKQKEVTEDNEANWISELLTEVIDNTPGEVVQTFRIEQRSFMDLKRPAHRKNNDPYLKWYSSLNKNSKILGHIVPRTRAVICVANRYLPIDFFEELKITDPGSQFGDSNFTPWIRLEFESYRIAIYSGTAATLRQGIYKFQVKLRQGIDLKPWNHLITNPNTDAPPTYTLAEMVRFNITNTAGEFSIVSLDPISLEESLITQYARCYTHLLSLVSSHNPTLKIDDANSVAPKGTKLSDNPTVKSPGFFQFAKMWAVTKSATELAAGIPMVDLGREFRQGSNSISTNGQVEFANQIGKALHTHLQGAEHEALRNSLNAYFAFNDGKAAFSELYNTRRTYERTMAQYGSWAQALRPRMVNLPPQLSEVRAYRNSLAGRYGIPHQHMIGFNAVLSRVNLAESALALSKDTFSYFSKLLTTVSDAKDNFMAVTESYHQLLSERKVEASIALRGLFDFNSYALSEEVKSTLSEKIDHILNLLGMQKDLDVYIGGHTCDIGSFEANKKLSQNRANAVKQFLEQRGVESNRIIAIGHGPIAPVADNDSEENRKKNRRVKIELEASGQSLVTPSREGMGTLERFRTLLTQQEITKDEKQQRLALQTVQVALGVLSCTPITAVAARAVIFAIEGSKAVVNLVSALDKMFMQGALNSMHDDFKRASAVSFK